MAHQPELTSTQDIRDILDETFVNGDSLILRLWYKEDMSDQLNVVFTDSSMATEWLNGLDVEWGVLKWSMMPGRLVSHSI